MENDPFDVMSKMLEDASVWNDRISVQQYRALLGMITSRLGCFTFPEDHLCCSNFSGEDIGSLTCPHIAEIFMKENMANVDAIGSLTTGSVSNGINFECNGGCSRCEAEAHFSFEPSCSKIPFDCFPHYHCVGCLELHQAASQHEGLCRAHAKQHFTDHCKKAEKIRAFLDGDCLSLSSSLASMDEDDLEVKADENRKHCCFLVAAGTASFPASVLFCSECNIFGPLTRFPCSEISDADEDIEGTDPISTSPLYTIVQRLLLAIFVSEQFHCSIVDAVESDCEAKENVSLGERSIFLYKSVLFDTDEANDLLEEDCEEVVVDVLLDGCSIDHDGCLTLCPTGATTVCGYMLAFGNSELRNARIDKITKLFVNEEVLVEEVRVFSRSTQEWHVTKLLRYDSTFKHRSSDVEIQFAEGASVQPSRTHDFAALFAECYGRECPFSPLSRTTQQLHGLFSLAAVFGVVVGNISKN